MSELNPKQERFCREYIIDNNGTQAAIRSGYSAKTAHAIAEKLLRKAEIQSRVRDLNQQIISDLRITREKVLRRLEAIAFGSLEGIVTIVNGRAVVTDTDALPPEKLDLINSVKVNESGRVSVTLHNPMPALQELSKITGLSGDFNLAIATLEKYGVYLKRKADGTWYLADANS